MYFACVMQLLVLILGIIVTIHMVEVGMVSDQNTNTVGQVVEDWNKIPFTSVRVTDDKCTSKEESVFVRNWAGTEQGCLVNKIDTWTGYSSEQVVMSISEYDSYINGRSSNGSSSNRSQNNYSRSNNARQREPCMPISMKGAVEQDEFFDMRFCGTRGGASFLHAQRPEYSDSTKKYACPSGYTACSTATKDESTVCVKTANKATDCPLT